ncbi:PLP-dependent aminotransferase family protein [Bacillaceae bacterium Marseille-Q3522]|nr:PLP-dependent aminotransferase family protein [Bacillaceae bacterium Marseille-Q3522]
MEYRFSPSSEWLDTNIIKEILKHAQSKEVISFAGGLPSEEFFPLEAISTAFQSVMAEGKATLQYGATEGYWPLREEICKRMVGKGIFATPEETLVTTGSQQVIDLVSRVMLDPHDVVFVESPAFFGATQVFESRGATIISIGGDKDGMDMEELQKKLKEYKPKLIYVTPSFSNPTGYVWSVEKRQQLIEICKKNQVLILEDDPYGDLKFTKGAEFPTIFSLDMEGKANNNCVIYTSSFSKIVAPALRSGWAIADTRVIEKLVNVKRVADTHSSSLDQQTLYHLLTSFDLDSHIRKISRHYYERMKMMSALLAEQPGISANWEEPHGGMFLWLELAKDIDTDKLLKIAAKEGVAFVPGVYFYTDHVKHHQMRLNFTHTDKQTTLEGLQRLQKAIEIAFIK